MRVFIVILGLSAVNASLCGQGLIGFNNSGASPEQKIYIDEWLNPAALAPGGDQFRVALCFAPVDGEESTLLQVGGSGTFLGTPDERYGLFFGGTRTVQTVNIGGGRFFSSERMGGSVRQHVRGGLGQPICSNREVFGIHR